MVDDEIAIRDLIREVLQLAAFEVIACEDGLAALNQLKRDRFDLIILDVNLPKIDGFALLKKIRESAPSQPIILIGARTDKDDVTHGLRLGADDYIRKPFSIEELVLRVENRFRRQSTETELACGPISMSVSQHKVTFAGNQIELSPTEFTLLQVLMENQNRVLTKEKLLDLVWGMDFATSTNVVDTYISYLRKKLHINGFEGIKTVRGIGFKLESK